MRSLLGDGNGRRNREKGMSSSSSKRRKRKHRIQETKKDADNVLPSLPRRQQFDCDKQKAIQQKNVLLAWWSP